MGKLKTLTDIDTKNFALQNKLPLESILMRDEITDNLKAGFYVINLDSSDQEETHWTVCDAHPHKSYYFDSYGFVPPLEFSRLEQ
jgi:hypothetical protein